MSIELEITHSEDYGTVKGKLTGEDPALLQAQVESEAFANLLTAAIHKQKLLADEMKLTRGLSDSTNAALAQYDPNRPGSTFTQQPAQPPAWAQQQPSNVAPLQQQAGETCTNPDGKSPAACGMALQPAETRTGKKQLKCPQYRYSSGQGGNGHRVVWL